MLLNIDLVYMDKYGVDKFMAMKYGRVEIGKIIFLPRPCLKNKETPHKNSSG